MLAIVGIGVAAYCLYGQFDEEIRRCAEERLAGHYKNLKVSVRSAYLVQGKGIRLHDVSLVERNGVGPWAELLHVEEVFLDCPTDWQELLRGNPPVGRVTIRRPTLRPRRLPNGEWSTQKLLPPPQFGDRPPEVVVEHGSIEMANSARQDAKPFILRDVSLTLSPVAAADGVAPGSRRLWGILAGDGIRRIEVEGMVNWNTPAYGIRGRAETLELSPELRDALPDFFSSRLQRLGDLRGQGDFGFQVDYDAKAQVPLRFHIAGNLSRGRIDDPRLPRSLTDIRAAVRVDNDGYAIDNLTARSGQASLRLSCRRSGLEETSPLSLNAEVRQLELDRALLAILPPSMQDIWRKYLPAGQIDADVQLDYDGKLWRPKVAVRCLNVSFSHYKFPYRVEHGKGTVDLKDDVLKADLTAYAGSRPVRITAEAVHPLSEPTGWFEARGDDLPIDESLVGALPEKPRDVVRSLDAAGFLGFYLRMWRDRADQPMHQHLVLSLNRGSIRFEKFPYPLMNIRGVLEMLDGAWTFRNIEGTNGAALVTCQGQLTPGFSGNELVLNFIGRDVPLEPELRNALSPHIQQAWHGLQPRGVVDLTAEVRYLPEQAKFSVGVRAEPQRDTASLEPVHFPYRLDRLQGVLLYQDGILTLQRAKAEHGAVKFAADGRCEFQPDGRWRLQLEGLTIDRIRADRELTQALPERLKKVVATLNLGGAVNLRGNLALERTGRPNEPLRSAWDLRAGLHQNSLQCGEIHLENLCGSVALRGAFDGEQFQSRGELALDSLSYKDCQLTRVMGPIWIDDGRLLFGAWVDRRGNGIAANNTPDQQPTAPRPLTAGLFGGTLYGDGWITLGPQPRYAVNATLIDADLARCAQEVTVARQKLRGKVLATADFSGTGFTRNAISGRGGIRLSDADVYELPVMISLLKILSIRPPNQNAFSDATIDYRIEGEHIYFDRIDFHGDAISLRGKGEMDFQSTIRLTFHALVGRGELDLPVVKQVFSGASQQLMLIHVAGTLQNPETHKEALPGVSQALQQIREELQNRR